ncbi:hypothetical protein [Rhizobium sp. C1]|uniref:hypothetical protein n=1 Tax=Rhizobium sp. C1 TaxID=1349799 RepID=UPI001E40F3F6|nr:hypothetical protein [Rhizobium sp. C1]MCD2178238.1 hypothetical protein [Rhizobium sp. C1]
MVHIVIKMTRPSKRPKTGVYEFRKREEKVNLGTRDPAEAKVAHARVWAEVEARWSQLSKGSISLTFKQAVGMVGETYREFVNANGDWPAKASPHMRMFAKEKIGHSEISFVGG